MLLLEAAINRYLALDPELPGKMAAFNGRVIQLEIKGVNKTFYLFPGDHGISIQTQYDGEADTVLCGSPVALFKMSLMPNVAKLLLSGEVEIKGDTRLGHQFKNLLSQMEIDWAAPLAELFGDAAAWQIESKSRELVNWGKQSSQALAGSLGEYFVEESRDIVSEAELENFNNEVDRLRDDADRLEARLGRLKF